MVREVGEVRARGMQGERERERERGGGGGGRVYLCSIFFASSGYMFSKKFLHPSYICCLAPERLKKKVRRRTGEGERTYFVIEDLVGCGSVIHDCVFLQVLRFSTVLFRYEGA